MNDKSELTSDESAPSKMAGAFLVVAVRSVQPSSRDFVVIFLDRINLLEPVRSRLIAISTGCTSE